MVFSFVFLLAPDMTPNYVSNRQLENPSTCGRHKAVCAWPMCGADREPGGLRGDRVNAETVNPFTTDCPKGSLEYFVYARSSFSHK